MIKKSCFYAPKMRESYGFTYLSRCEFAHFPAIYFRLVENPQYFLRFRHAKIFVDLFTVNIFDHFFDYRWHIFDRIARWYTTIYTSKDFSVTRTAFHYFSLIFTIFPPIKQSRNPYVPCAFLTFNLQFHHNRSSWPCSVAPWIYCVLPLSNLWATQQICTSTLQNICTSLPFTNRTLIPTILVWFKIVESSNSLVNT